MDPFSNCGTQFIGELSLFFMKIFSKYVLVDEFVPRHQIYRPVAINLHIAANNMNAKMEKDTLYVPTRENSHRNYDNYVNKYLMCRSSHFAICDFCAPRRLRLIGLYDLCCSDCVKKILRS